MYNVYIQIFFSSRYHIIHRETKSSQLEKKNQEEFIEKPLAVVLQWHIKEKFTQEEEWS